MIRLWMNSIEPTSTPRVGCDAISTLSGRENSRATTTFCWLPPDSDATGASADSVRMSNSSIRAFGVRGDLVELERRARGELVADR